MDTIATRMFVNQDMSGTVISQVVNLNNMLHMGVHAVWTGTPAGDLYLEVSAQTTPSSWEVIASASVAGAGSQLWLDRNCPYKWVRLRYVPTGSTGTINADAMQKGDE